MAELFKTKIRRVGTSVGVLIPREHIAEARLHVGEEVEIALLSHKDLSGFGFAKGYRVSFQRDKRIRDFR
ncbi:MAG TPA: hypothetical protein VJC21_04370 [Candidatus Nanoarchaeia archaeon]|nr:hypothetical protein [Candidatus Nanoarchaeia archaeon]